MLVARPRRGSKLVGHLELPMEESSGARDARVDAEDFVSGQCVQVPVARMCLYSDA